MRTAGRWVNCGMRIFLLALAVAASAALHAQVGTNPKALTKRIEPQLQRPPSARPAAPAAASATAPAGLKAQPTAADLDAGSAAEKAKLDQQIARAEKGSDAAQLNLGIRYLNGEGIEKNPKLARKWLEAAAKQGNAGAKKLLAQHPELPPLDPEPAAKVGTKN